MSLVEFDSTGKGRGALGLAVRGGDGCASCYGCLDACARRGGAAELKEVRRRLGINGDWLVRV